jgi:hypothetical protein
MFEPNGMQIPIMIRQDHLMGRPRNAESITICSIGTIRDGISTGAPNHETFRWNEGVVITAPGSTHETFLRNEIGGNYGFDSYL